MTVYFSSAVFLLSLFLSPLIRGVINRVKAWFGGRKGPSLLQPYYDLFRLLKKGSVYSKTTTWIFKAAPLINLGAAVTALLFLPSFGLPSIINFEGDLVLFVYLLASGRFFMILSALDTGSSFEGMGASRETFYSALTEPALLFALAGLSAFTGSLSLSGIYSMISKSAYSAEIIPALVFIVFSLLIIFLAENSRIPVDDPQTHLELTMIHEVMILDNSGPDLAIIEYTGSLKLWIFGILLISLFPVFPGIPQYLTIIYYLLLLFLFSSFIGVIESVMARLKMIQIPRLLVIASAFSALWFIWIVR